MMKIRKLKVYLGIYFLSVATLTFEIGLTRLFSIAQGYHFAFMVISIALLGIGAGGSIMMFRPLLGEKDSNLFLSRMSIAFSLSILFCFIVSNHILFDPVKAAWSSGEFIKIFFQYLILSFPFIFFGIILSFSIKTFNLNVSRIYFADLAGGGTGCLLILLILYRFGGEMVVIISSFFGFLSAFLFNRFSIKQSVLYFVGIFLTLGFSAQFLEVQMSPYRELSMALNFPGAHLEKTLFSPSGRLTIIDSPLVRSAPGISLNFVKALPYQKGFTINGGHLSTVTQGEGDLSFLRSLPSSLPFRLKPSSDVFIIDAGGGMELLLASLYSAKKITGSEVHKNIYSVMKGEFAPFSGKLYEKYDIRYGSGRRVLRDLKGFFDIIQFPMTSTLGLSSSGIGGVAEDYSLTKEAFQAYYKHLKTNGIFTISMYLLLPPRGELKVLASLVEVWEENQQREVWRSFLVIRSWGVITIVAKKGIIGERDISRLKAFTESENFDLVFYPGMEPGEANRYNRFDQPIYFNLAKQILDPRSRKGFYDDYLFQIRPATDDQPFYSHFFKILRFKETFESMGRKWGVLMDGGFFLPIIFLQSILASLLLVFTPLIFFKKSIINFRVIPSVAFYFSSIGIAFMFLEISLIQWFVPLMGEPVYAISAVLFSVLISSGLGSYSSEYLFKNPQSHRKPRGMHPLGIKKKIFLILLSLPLLIVIYLSFFNEVSLLVMENSLPYQYLLTFIILFPLGFLMGIPFPTGMRIIGEKNRDLVPLAWCVNASSSVVSSILAMLIALSFGFTTVFILAALFYLFAFLSHFKMQSI